ncbi:hypothetical protein M0802_005842 [Mischocyttarus mexicanus]|nr:hypothetical protein M0802_005842 [Mischocyttarus mexicanus]
MTYTRKSLYLFISACYKKGLTVRQAAKKLYIFVRKYSLCCKIVLFWYDIFGAKDFNKSESYLKFIMHEFDLSYIKAFVERYPELPTVNIAIAFGDTKYNIERYLRKLGFVYVDKQWILRSVPKF